MLPSRQVVDQHRSPRHLNTSTEASEGPTRPKLPLKGAVLTKKRGVNTMGDIQFRPHVKPRFSREGERANRFLDAALLCFTRIAG